MEDTQEASSVNLSPSFLALCPGRGADQNGGGYNACKQWQ